MGYKQGMNCIIGEYWMDFCLDRKEHEHPLTIGNNALVNILCSLGFDVHYEGQKAEKNLRNILTRFFGVMQK